MAATRIYAGTHDGLKVLHVKGETCALAHEAFSGQIVQAVGGGQHKAGRVFAGLRDGLFRSDDAGAYWRKVLDGDFRCIQVDPTDDEVIYAGTDPVHLYRSEDGGQTWNEIESLQGLPEETHRKLGEVEKVDMAAAHTASFRHRRQDWWFPVPPHQGHILQIFIHPDDPKFIMLAIEHGGVALSTDRGKTWEDVSQGVDYLDMHYVTSLPHRFDSFLVTSARGFYSTPDPRQGWMRAQDGCDRNYFHDIVLLPPRNGGGPDVVIATADGSPGFWPATAGKEHWDHSAVGSRAALFRSSDEGQSWRRIGTGDCMPDEMNPFIWALLADPTEPNGMFAGLGESTGVPSPARRGAAGSVLYSADRGDSWRLLKDGIAAVEHLHVAPD